MDMLEFKLKVIDEAFRNAKDFDTRHKLDKWRREIEQEITLLLTRQ